MRNSLRALDGVTRVEVDLEEKTAVVVYQASKLDVQRLISATTAIGFPSAVQEPSANPRQ